MTWLNLWALPLLILPLLAFIHRRKIRQQHDVPSLLYYRDLVPKRVFPSLQFMLRKERIIYACLLLLAVIIMLDPVIRGRAERTLLVLDNSASMGASHEQRTQRWDTAIKQAKSAASAALSSGDSVAVVPLLNRKTVPTYVREPAELEQQFAKLTLLNWGARLERRVPELLAIKKRDEVGELVVYTDRDLAAQVADISEQLRWVNVAENSKPNVAITAVHQPQHLHDYPYRTEVAIRNFGQKPVQDVYLQRMDTAKPKPISGSINLLPGEQQVIEVPQYILGTVLEPVPVALGFGAESKYQDGLLSDNAIYVLPDDRRKLNVLLIKCAAHSTPLWSRVFPHPGINFKEIAVNESIPGGQWDVVIGDHCQKTMWEQLNTLQKKDATALNIGNRILIQPGVASEPVGVASQASPHDNPVLEDVKRMLGMVMYSATKLKVPTSSASKKVTLLLGGLPTLKSESAYSYMVEGNYKELVFGFDVHGFCDSSEEGQSTYQQDDCLSLSFMMLNALSWMDARPQRPLNYLPTGLVFAQNDADNGQLRDKNNQRLQPIGGRAQWLLDGDGAWRFSSDQDMYWLSAALLDSHESALPSTPVQLDERDLQLLNTYHDRPFWPTLFRILCCLLLLEALLLWWLWSRKRAAT